ncbi:uncharacterized protein FA14DRAFT_63832 [Meira miltonrushii]|uniref:Uncharacterized protein n=1 Tax=Meira miltonrushii TaxID=1280837 RepID=A0A316VBI7_9BASI|nr:uncharacterized protein FA14DRAFT_63832 [Meira miltonrushii]PWN33613.1 hypothetical protein FA14DRAFT_63832 [Meira miltonrushii]
MADEGAGVWGASIDDDGVGQSQKIEIGESSERPATLERRESKPAPRLFDDLGDAGWGSPDGDQPSFDKPAPITPTAPSQSHADPEFEDALTGNEGYKSENGDKHFPDEQQDDDPHTFISDDEDNDEPFGFQDRTPKSDLAAFEDFKEGPDEGDDDDFGDFGEFEEEAQTDQFGSPAQPEVPLQQESRSAPQLASGSSWQPLAITPNSTSASIANDVRQLLSAPLSDGRTYPFHDGAASQLSQDQIRQVDGPSQILVREESRAAWSALSKQPELKPVDWMRSKTRRQYLIAVGVPINLDELNTTNTNGSKALPPLALKLDRGARGSEVESGPTSQNDGKVGSAKSTRERDNKPPEFDTQRAKSIVAMTEDQLTLLGLPALRELQRETEALTRQASTVLTHYLSQRESHSTDAEMYNGLIKDLVTGAAKRVSTTSSSSVQRQVSVRKSGIGGGNLPNSGRNSPAISNVQAQSYPGGRSSSPR